MGGAYGPPQGSGLDAVIAPLRDLARRSSALERPTGTQLSSLVAQVQAALANINATVAAAIAANSYTRAQVDTKVASPGNISPGNVTASGTVSSAGALVSPGSYGYAVASSYKSVWIDGVTFGLGYSPSAQIVKKGLTQMSGDDARRLLNLTPYWGRYLWDEDDAPLRVFFLAADVQAAGFGPDVAPVVDGAEPLQMIGTDGQPILGADGEPVVVPVGEAYTVNYSQIVVPLVAAWRDGAQQMQAMQASIDSLTARLAAAGIA